jgi:hypothetical protein
MLLRILLRKEEHIKTSKVKKVNINFMKEDLIEHFKSAVTGFQHPPPHLSFCNVL